MMSLSFLVAVCAVLAFVLPRSASSARFAAGTRRPLRSGRGRSRRRPELPSGRADPGSRPGSASCRAGTIEPGGRGRERADRSIMRPVILQPFAVIKGDGADDAAPAAIGGGEAALLDGALRKDDLVAERGTRRRT